jgi:hypothetical protein
MKYGNQLSFLGATIKSLRFCFEKLLLFHTLISLFTFLRLLHAMDDRQPSKRRKLAAEKMEQDLNRSLRQRGSEGRPSHDESPQTTPFVEPATIQTLPSDKPGPGSVSARSAPPPEGIAAPVTDALTSAHNYDGPSYSGQRGAYPEGYEHGEFYGGRLTMRFNSSLVDNDEAASRAEWLYQSQGQASRTASYGAPYSHPFPSTRSNSLRTSFDGQERESQSFQALNRIEDIMAKMERHMVASTPAPVVSTAPHHTPFRQGKFCSFHFHF